MGKVLRMDVFVLAHPRTKTTLTEHQACKAASSMEDHRTRIARERALDTMGELAALPFTLFADSLAQGFRNVSIFLFGTESA